MRRARIKVAPSLGPRLAKSEPKTEKPSQNESQTTESSTQDTNTDQTSSSNLPEQACEMPSSQDITPTSQISDATQTTETPQSTPSTQESISVLQPETPINVVPEPVKPSPEKPAATASGLRFNKFKPKPNLSRPVRKPNAAEPSKETEPKPEPVAEPIHALISSDSPSEAAQEPEEISTTVAEDNSSVTAPPAAPADLERLVSEKDANEETRPSSSQARHFRSRAQRIRPNIGEGAGHRVRTFSSASESEDDHGRKRVRTSSVTSRSEEPGRCSVAKTREEIEDEEDEARITGKAAKKVREKTALQLRKEEVMKKVKAGNLERNKLTMFDLIFYNPTSNPLPKDKSKKSTSKETENVEPAQEEEEEEEVVEVQTKEEDEDEVNTPGPRVKVGANGEIILDEQSLVIETTEAKRNRAEILSKPVIVETNNGYVNYGSWRKTKRSKTWTVKETARFYRALSMLGTDFSLMESLFPNRTRPELKKKFKIEEKQNRGLIDNTIRSQKQFDPSVFGPETDSDEESVVEESTKKSKKGKENEQKKEKDSKKSKKSSSQDPPADSAIEPSGTPNPAPFKKPRARKQTTVLEQEIEELPVAQTVEVMAQDEGQEEDQAPPPSKMDLMLQSPLGQLSMQAGGVTMPGCNDPENPSMLLNEQITQANPALAQAQEGSLVLVATDNPEHPGKKIIHVYKVKTGGAGAEEPPTQ